MAVDWHSRFEQQGQAASARCAGASNPPRVAVCISGAARTFATPLLLAGLRHNFLAPLVNHASAARVFLYLKSADSAKRGDEDKGFRPQADDVRTLRRALLKARWLQPMLGEAVLVNGSGSFSGPSPSPHTFAVVPSDATSWRGYRTTACLPAEAGSLRGSAGECCSNRPKSFKGGNGEERLLLSQLGLAWCGGAIVRSEAALGAAYDVVLSARPDLLWWRPMHAWCEWPHRTHALSCDRPGCDAVWAAPRQHLSRLFGLRRGQGEAGPRGAHGDACAHQPG